MSNFHIKHLEEYYQVYRKSVETPEKFSALSDCENAEPEWAQKLSKSAKRKKKKNADSIAIQLPTLPTSTQIATSSKSSPTTLQQKQRAIQRPKSERLPRQ